MKIITLCIFTLIWFLDSYSYAQTRLKTIARLSALVENPITGYGLVIGLAGSGDSRRSKDTTQAIANLLLSFGVNVSPNDINSRNVASVIISANLPAHAHLGDKLDITVSSLGDAKSLLGGTLVTTPLKGADNQIYALAQGSLSIGGFKYDLNGNIVQKNHPTTGLISDGAIVEKTLYNDTLDKTGDIHIILNHPDYTTAFHVETALNTYFNANIASAHSAQDIEVHPPKEAKDHYIRFISQLENIEIITDQLPTVVVNERTGVIVAGADVTIDAVTISHGNLQISIGTSYQVSQPTMLSYGGPAIRTAITPATSMAIREPENNSFLLKEGSTIEDLMTALNKLHTPTRDIIAILETLKRAGALHAELLIQ